MPPTVDTAGETANVTSRLQPLLHDLVVTVAAPALAVSSQDGDIATGVEGVYLDDTRLLSRLELRIAGEAPESLRGQVRGAGRARFVSVVRTVGEHRADPTVLLTRTRDMAAIHTGDVVETLTVRNSGRTSVELPVVLRVGSDLADMGEVRSGRGGRPRVPAVSEGGLHWQGDQGHEARLTATPVPELLTVDGVTGEMGWQVTLGPGAEWSVSLRLQADTGGGVVLAPSRDVLGELTVTAADRRVAALVEQSLGDLRGLVVADAREPADHLACAGAPWYLTFFGRDALWTARMALPLGTELAAGTLGALARRQGTVVDPESEEAPGKILHEVRGGYTAPSGDLSLPPLYYGTVDATPLFVTLLAEAWRWGLPEEQVAALLSHAERALAWMREHGDPDGDGFLEYVRSGPGGLSNQGWKDSADSIQHADGRLATAPIALSEVQAYAYQAATLGADLLDAFGRPHADRWREWAGALRRRFRESFWIDHPDGAYPAIALDADKRPVDGVASNMGHLLGTGLLDPEEAGLVARRLASTRLDSGFGLRTLASDMGGYNPQSYHGGTVWPHDTAIAIAGLARDGFTDEAVSLARGLVAAAPGFDYRLPELYAGDARSAGWEPLPYPSACRPQAWSAAAAISMLTSLLGVEPDVPSGRLRLATALRPGLGALDVHGIRVGSGTLSVRVEADGAVTVLESPPGLRLER